MLTIIRYFIAYQTEISSWLQLLKNDVPQKFFSASRGPRDSKRKTFIIRLIKNNVDEVLQKKLIITRVSINFEVHYINVWERTTNKNHFINIYTRMLYFLINTEFRD